MRTSGKAGFLSTQCRTFTIRRKEFWRPPTGGLRQTATNIRSARIGMCLGGRIAFIACWNRARNLRLRICWRCRWMCLQPTTGSAPTSSCMRSITRRMPPTGRSGRRTFCGTGMDGCQRMRRRRQSRPRLVRNWCGCCWNQSWAQRRRVRVQAPLPARSVGRVITGVWVRSGWKACSPSSRRAGYHRDIPITEAC